MGRLSKWVVAAVFACLVLTSAGSSLALAAPAQVTYESFKSFEVENPCTGDLLTVSGMVHVVFRVGFTRSGQMHVVIVEKAADWTVVDALGNAYLPTGQPGQFIINGDSTTESFSLTLINRQWFISAGEDGNIMVRRVAHIQVTPNGTVTEVHDFISVECRG